ncbi:MAG: DUF1669 domain-containing protein, partial [Candidatus Riflebacteria bacterium]|nr:DUF1669 domain-containing protein [Candidatus Riflebacteria bacterium]
MKTVLRVACLLVVVALCSGGVLAGSLEVYFGPTKPGDKDGLDTQTVKVINSAKKRINGAIHELRLGSIADALVAAHKRGVEVRIVGDDDYYENEFMKKLRQAGIKTKSDENTKYIMHDKFVVADGARMTTGSYNLTDTCSYNNYNNLLVIEDAKVCELYDAEFEKLWAGNMYGASDGAVHSLSLKVGGRNVPVEIFFQPRFQGTQDKIVELLTAARKSIHMAQFAFFSATVANVLAAKREAGLEVKAVIDYAMVYGELMPLNQIGTLAEKAVPFCIGDDPKGKLHHKLFVVDADGDDPVVITGSANASSSGFKGNVENIIVIHDGAIAKRYRDEVVKLFKRRDAGAATTKPRGLNGVGREQHFDVFIDSGGVAMKSVEVNLPYAWKINSAKDVEGKRDGDGGAVEFRLEERLPSAHHTEKVQVLVADSANLAASGPDSKMTLRIKAMRLAADVHTGKTCLYIRGSDKSGELKALASLPIIWLFRSALENVQMMDKLLNASDPQSARDLEYLMRDVQSSLYDDIEYNKLAAVKEFVAVIEKAQQSNDPRFKLVSNGARLVCQRMVATFGTDGEGGQLAAKLKEILDTAGVVVKPPRPDDGEPVEGPEATPEGMAKEVVASLVRYHNTDGQGNGSPFTGVQFFPGVTDKAQLEKGFEKLATWLAKRKEIVYTPAPEDQRARTAFRRKIAADRSQTVTANTKAYMKAGLAYIKDATIRSATEKAVAAAPAEFFQAPSSSSGKHHPADEINPGGLALHSLRDVVFGELLCDYYKVKGKQRDEILAALLLHDLKKGGEPWANY